MLVSIISVLVIIILLNIIFGGKSEEEELNDYVNYQLKLAAEDKEKDRVELRRRFVNEWTEQGRTAKEITESLKGDGIAEYVLTEKELADLRIEKKESMKEKLVEQGLSTKEIKKFLKENELD
mgnify:CR=1 FL=1